MKSKINLEHEYLKMVLDKLSIYNISIYCDGYEREFKKGTKGINIEVKLNGNFVNAACYLYGYDYQSNIEMKYNKTIEDAIGEALIELDYKMSASY